MSAAKRSDRTSQWLVQLKERVGWQKAVVALANKNACILWAVLTRDGVSEPDHVPHIQATRQKPRPICKQGVRSCLLSGGKRQDLTQCCSLT
jgi:transposase